MTKKPAYGSNTSSRYNMARIELEVPTRICNSTSTQPLKLSDYRKTPARMGSEDFLRCKSKGI